MTNTEVEMLQEVKKEKDDNKKDKKKGEEMKDDEEEQKKKVRNTNISQNSVSHMLRQRGWSPSVSCVPLLHIMEYN